MAIPTNPYAVKLLEIAYDNRQQTRITGDRLSFPFFCLLLPIPTLQLSASIVLF
ncbi:hypothetical protein BDV25DRAFT_158390 [Aspergillus avenaceus]|uniref:Uncharacterized protein n=1 Tax=Aspergillus avenaceus TaxID=36643 RepID=A0A5N6TPW2_ASPAV|nr:hypothetical protein BDV25DRAFT_158390 [Aspergillus avenaceus]